MTIDYSEPRAPSRLTFLGDTPTPTTNPRWGVYACECGWIGKKRVADVNRGRARSCGCLNREISSKRATTHGHTVGGKVSPTYAIWQTMHDRCSNPNNKRWERYGGRGIKVCERWGDFENFFADMGEHPAGMAIDRKDNDRGYEPDNCAWATPVEQAYNRSTTLQIEWRGRMLTTLDLAQETGIPAINIRERLNSGWSVERAATTPVRPSYQKSKVQ
jgi:hypothetical protein